MTTPWNQLLAPLVGGPFVLPPSGPEFQPVCGHRNGLFIGIAPMPGPRGLIRIYTPYLGHPPGRMINYVAVEPIPAGQRRRGFSELERSSLDDEPGKRFTFATDHELTPERLSARIEVERFDNGASVWVTATFHRDRPHEVELCAFAHADSAPLDYVILTATMGNYARLRLLDLAGRQVSAGELWPDFSGDGFAPHRRFGEDELLRDETGEAVLRAVGDEENPTGAAYHPDTPPHWRYEGQRAVQYWRTPLSGDPVIGQVNGRTCFWAGKIPIPGGVSYENVELVAPFRGERTYTFGVEPLA